MKAVLLSSSLQRFQQKIYFQLYLCFFVYIVCQLSLSSHHLSSFLWIGLSAGRISQVIVGDEQRQYLLVIGRDVDGVQLAQRLAQANEIVLSWNCWKLCEQYMFEVEIMREDEAVKVGGWSHPLKVLKRTSCCTGQYSGGAQHQAKPVTTGTLFWREVRDTLPGKSGGIVRRKR